MTEVWAVTGDEQRGGTQAFVQWKGTDVCLDFRCACGGKGHYDGLFAYGLRCGQCGRVWMLPHTFGLVEISEDDVVTQQPIMDGHGP